MLAFELKETLVESQKTIGDAIAVTLVIVRDVWGTNIALLAARSNLKRAQAH